MLPLFPDSILPIYVSISSTLPNKQFSTDAPQDGRAKIRKRVLFSYACYETLSLTTYNTGNGKFDELSQKKNAAILRRFNHFMQTKTRELYSPVLSLLASSMPFAVADMIFKSVSLIVSSMVSS